MENVQLTKRDCRIILRGLTVALMQYSDTNDIQGKHEAVEAIDKVQTILKQHLDNEASSTTV